MSVVSVLPRTARFPFRRRPRPLAALAMVTVLLAGVAVLAAPAQRSEAAGSVVRFVYFVEQGETARPDVEQAIGRQARALQRFWFEQFGGTFRLADPVVSVLPGRRPSAWYDSTPNGDDPRWYRLRNISEEVKATLGGPTGQRFVNYPATTISRPRVGATTEGAWMDGDDALCITGGTQTFPYPNGVPANCLGHVAHEFGHTYGLTHSGPESDCMLAGMYTLTPLCDFSAGNRAAVRNNPANAGWLDVTLDPADPGSPQSQTAQVPNQQVPNQQVPNQQVPNQDAPEDGSPNPVPGLTPRPDNNTVPDPAADANIVPDNVPVPTPDPGSTGSAGAQAEVVRLVNVERGAAGCPPLTAHPTLTTVARAHSQDMAQRGYFAHQSPEGRSPIDRATAAGYTFSRGVAENIAAGQPTPAAAMTSWMGSPGHRANILDCALTEIGVGFHAQPGSQYGTYWTQDFGTPR